MLFRLTVFHYLMCLIQVNYGYSLPFKLITTDSDCSVLFTICYFGFPLKSSELSVNCLKSPTDVSSFHDSDFRKPLIILKVKLKCRDHFSYIGPLMPHTHHCMPRQDSWVLASEDCKYIL